MNDKIKILAVETSGKVCGVAISEGNNILCAYSNYMNNMHDQVLARTTQILLEDTDMTLEDIDIVTISSGPGSFTGLRIGGAFVKALCFDGTPKLLPVSSLEALAYQAVTVAKTHDKNSVIAAIQAHQKLIYIQEFDLDMTAKTEIQMISSDELEYSDNVFYIGTGIKSSTEDNILDGKKIAKYAAYIYDEDKIVEPNEFIPNYIQDFEPKKSKKKLNI